MLRHPDFERRDLSSLRQGYYGASAMPVEVLREIAQRLPDVRLFNFYGQTEMSPMATLLRPEDQLRKAGSAGLPAINVETRVVDDQDQPLPPGEVGEIVHRSPHAMLGYWNDPEKTAATFRNGWFHSGDLGVIDDEGYLSVVDRKKDMIKTGGENVASREVEETIYAHPAVKEVAIFGISDPRWIEAVTAAVVLRDGEDVYGGGPDRLLSRAPRRLQGAQVRRPARRAPQERERQAPQARAARPVRVARRSPNGGPIMSRSIVIAGGGFGGLAAARTLERVLPPHSARVTLVSDSNFLLYTPLLPGAAGASVELRHVVVPLRHELKRTELRVARVVGADPARQCLRLRSHDGEESDLGYDQLILAMGSVSRTLPIPGLVEHAIGLKTLPEAFVLRNRVTRMLEVAEEPGRRRRPRPRRSRSSSWAPATPASKASPRCRTSPHRCSTCTRAAAHAAPAGSLSRPAIA